MQLRASTIFFLVALLVSAFTATPALAQTQITTGVIQGVVVDETDAVMPGASVTIRNTETNFEQTSDTDENGRFVFLQLRPGPYTLRASRDGFTTLVQENLSLGVGQTIPLTMTMRVSPVAEEVVVTATPTVDVVKTESSTSITYIDISGTCPAGFSLNGGPLLLYLQGASTGLSSLPFGASNIDNEDFGFFVQDKWQIRPNFTLNFGLRWDLQYMAEIVADPSTTSYGPFLSDPSFPSDGTLPDQEDMIQPRVGFAWDVLNNGKSVFRASWGLYYARHNMLAQVGSITDNGVQQQVDVALTGFTTLSQMPTWPNTETPFLGTSASPFASVRITASNFENPRTQTVNLNWEQEFAPDWAYYVDFTWAKRVHLTRFINYHNGGGPDLTDPCANEFGVIDPSQPTGAAICGDGNPPPTDGNSVDRRHAQEVQSRLPVGMELSVCQGHGRRLQRARPLYRPLLQPLRLLPGLLPS